MKKIKFIIATICTALVVLAPMVACGDDPVDKACDTVEGMASQEDKAQEALDDFHQDADDKDAEYQEILDMAE
ncbi:MAG: hypothetical protein J6Z07_00305 [Lachnospiraceae bacterium]|nr:hypothetical protein [Lachnospiraceae bacterium]